MSVAAPKPTERAVISDETLRGLMGYRMKRAFNVVQADLAHTLKPFELRMLTFTALVLIVDNPGLRQSQLASAMDMERPNMVSLIDELEERGLIVRGQVPTDRRAYALRPTEQGQALCAAALHAVNAHETDLLHGVDSAELETTRDVLRQIEQARGREGS